MMMYYFEAEPAQNSNDDPDENYDIREGFSGGGVNNYRSDATIVENQDILNAAVRDGYDNGAIGNGSSNDNGANGNGHGSVTPIKGMESHYHDVAVSPAINGKSMLAASVRGPKATFSNLQPTGIIDLECYSSINRSALHDCVFELTGDARTNPDLRSFYFQAADVEDCELWTTALLSDRHQALKDESEAYKQVCDSFQLQLQNMSDMIDEAEGKTDVAERELYNVRSQAEKGRKDVAEIVREALEQQPWGSPLTRNGNNNLDGNNKILDMARLNYLDQLDEILALEDSLRSSNKSNRSSPVQLLADYLATVVGSHTELSIQLTSIEQKLNQTATVDNAAVSDLKLRLEKVEAEREEQKATSEENIASMESHIKESQQAFEDLENQLQTQRMEFSMFQSQAKSKLQELSSHKKILKKEVIELRKQKEEVESERDAALHITDSHKMNAENAKEKTDVLEKYIENMENQVRVQQNMMEMISLSGMSQSGMSQLGDGNNYHGGSVVGRIIGAPDDNSFSSFGNMQQRLRDASPLQNRLPPTNRTRLPPGQGQPPVSSITKKEIVTSPLSPRSAKKQVHKFGADSFDTDDGGFQIPMSRNGSGSLAPRGVLDDELNVNGDGNNYGASRTPVLNRHLREDGKERDRNIHRRLDDDGTPKTNNHQDDEDEGDDDNKTNVSELTEDRTQRHLDSNSTSIRQIHYTRSDNTGENIIGDGRGFRTKTTDGRNVAVKYEKAPPPSVKEKEDFPPRYISAPDQPDANDQSDILSTTRSEVTMFSTTNKTKLSIAQKARIAASQKSNTIDITSVSETMKLSDTLLAEAEKQVAEKPSSTPTRKSRGRARSQSPGVFSSLGKSLVSAIDNSIIGVRAADNAAKSGNANSNINTPLSPQEEEETKLTLVQRKKLQRERQLQVLREKGLLKKKEVENEGGPEH